MLEEVGLAVELLGEPAPVVEARVQRVDLVFRARPADESRPTRRARARPRSPRWRGSRRDALPELQLETVQALMALARSASPGALP